MRNAFCHQSVRIYILSFFFLTCIVSFQFTVDWVINLGCMNPQAFHGLGLAVL